MSTRSPQVEAGEVVVVHLSQVSQELRLQAADVLIRKAGLDTFAAIELSMAAAAPVEDPYLVVPAAKARIVLEEGRFPVGPFPVF
jgi:hypothetical protein